MNINGVEYQVRVTGDGAPVVALHGFTGSGANWSADLFPPRTQLIAPDLLGHGATESPDNYRRYGISTAARDLVDLIVRTTTPPVTLLGYSMGGRLALDFALHHTEYLSKLVLESASPGIDDEFERMARRGNDYTLAERIERDGVEAFMAKWEQNPLFATQSPEVRERLRVVRLAQNPVGLANSLRGMGTGAQPSYWNRLGELHLPVLLIAGELDTKFTAIARRMSERLTNCTLAIIAGAGHTVHLEQPTRYAEIVQRFLAS